MRNVTLFFFLSLFMLSSISFSQGYYAKLGGGYNLSFNSDNFGTSSSGDENRNYEAVNGSLGEGINFAGAFGYNFPSNVGVELGFIYKLPQEFEEIDQFMQETYTSTIKGSFFAFVPTFVISAPSKNVTPFAKLGLLVAIPSTEVQEVDSDGDTEKATFQSGVDFGLTGGAGILVPISTTIDFFVEVDFISFTWKPAEVEVTESDGTTRTIKFEDEWTSNDENTQGPYFLPFSNVGLNIGIQIGL